MAFYGRLKLIYGAKWEFTFPDERTLQLSRREFARDVVEIGQEGLEQILATLKRKRREGDDDYAWPDIGKILGLHNPNDGRKLLMHKEAPAWFKPRRQTKSQYKRNKEAAQKAREALKDIWPRD